MWRSLSTIALRWYAPRCAVAIALTTSACSAAFAAPGGQMMSPYRMAQAPAGRIAQMQGQMMPNGQADVMVNGGSGQMAPLPAEGYRDGSYPGDYYGNGSSGYGNGGGYGSCGCGDACGDCAGGCMDGYCASDCGGYGDCGYGCGGCGDYGCCDYSCGDCGCDAFCGIYQPRCTFYVDWLALQVTDADVTHAQQQDGLGGAGTVPFGQIGSVEIDYDSGVRFGGSIGCNECSSVVWSFTNFESYNEDRVVPPSSTITGAVGSLVHHPGAAITASNGPVNAAYDVDYRMFDLMCRNHLTGGPCYAVNYMFGVQYGHLEQFFIQDGFFSGGQGGAIDTFTNIDFDGAGVKAGFDAERSLCWGFMTYAKATAAIMTGRFHSRYDMVNTSTEVLLARARWEDDRVVPHLEYELGLGWTSPSGHWRFTTGYMLSHWANVVTTSEFIDAVQADNYTDVEGDVTFDGAVSRVELRW